MYLITGIDRQGRRFNLHTSNRRHALGINLYRGSVWSVDQYGARTLLKRVTN